MHFRTHSAGKHKGKSGGQGDYNDVMVEHDENIGMMLDKLDGLGIADDTIVMSSTDNGVHCNSWPAAGITPFRSEKNTNWEGGWRVRCFMRWPGQFKAGTVLNDIVTHQDWLPTLLAAAGAGHQGEASGRPYGRREDLPCPYRGFQHAALPEGRGDEESTGIILLHQ
jgi:arylsulfatase